MLKWSVMKVRVKFTKIGSVRFIGHLDLMRFFQKTLRRAKIPMRYSGGYSPHPLMTFAAPLGIGIESLAEYVDLEMADDYPVEDFAEAFNAQSVEGIKVVQAKRIPDHTPNAMSSVAAADYEITLHQNTIEIDKPTQIEALFMALKVRIPALLSQEEVCVTKTQKNEERIINIRPGILQLEVMTDRIRMRVDASSAGSIKPSLVMQALLSDFTLSFPTEDFHYMRHEVYQQGENGVFIPLLS
jgi:radical SAM-linked protein